MNPALDPEANKTDNLSSLKVTHKDLKTVNLFSLVLGILE